MSFLPIRSDENLWRSGPFRLLRIRQWRIDTGTSEKWQAFVRHRDGDVVGPRRGTKVTALRSLDVALGKQCKAANREQCRLSVLARLLSARMDVSGFRKRKRGQR